METRAMDMKIRRRHSNGKWYLVRPYLKPNLDDIGNVNNFSIVGKPEEVSLNEKQAQCYREMQMEIDRYLSRFMPGTDRIDCDVKEYPTERRVMNLLHGGGGIVFPVTGIYLTTEYGETWE